MSRKLSIPFAMVLIASLLIATSQLSALQSVAEPEPVTTARAAQLNAKLKDLDLERQKLEQEKSIQEAKIGQLRNEIQTMQEKHFKKGISSESYTEIVNTLQTQRVQLMIDLAGLEARQRAVQEYRAAKNANPLFLEVINKMQEQVALLKQTTEEVMELNKRNVGSQMEVREAQRSLLAAEIQLRQMQLSNGDSPEHSGDELRRIALERAEKSARMTKAAEFLQELETVPEELNLLSQLKSQDAMMWNRLQELKGSISRVLTEYDDTTYFLRELMKKQADDN